MFKPVEPYKLWNIDKTDFPSKNSTETQIKFLLSYAILAPSAFNVQPWKFSIKGRRVTIYPDFTRALSTSDKNNRLLYISIGCVLKNLEFAALAHGFEIKSQVVREGKESKVEVIFTPNSTEKDYGLLKSITNRLTNRSEYLQKKLPEKFITEVNKITKNNDFKFIIKDDKKIQEKVIDLTVKADMVIWNDPNFKAQHLKWVRHNLTTERDGMPAFTVGIPLLASFFAKPVIMNKNFAKFQANKNKKVLKTTPHFAFILSKNHNQESWIKVGELFEEVSLIATKYELAVAPLAEIVEVGEIYKETMKVLKTNLRPQMFFRLGFPTKKAEHSPRRNIDNLLTKDGSMDDQQVTKVKRAEGDLIKKSGTNIETNNIKIGGYNIHYITAGQGPPLLLVHGANIGWGQWYLNVKQFSDNFKVFAIDLPGSGLSTKVDESDMNFDKVFVQVTSEFINKMNIAPVNFVGHSFGGWIGKKIASKSNEQINKLVLVNTPGFGNYAPFKFKLTSISPIMSLLKKTKFKPSRKNTQNFLESAVEKPESIKEELVEYVYTSSEIPGSHTPISLVSKSVSLAGLKKEYLTTDFLDKIKCPTLIIWGEKDSSLPISLAKKGNKLLPNSRLHIHSNVGHVPNIENPTLFNEHVIKFLKQS